MNVEEMIKNLSSEELGELAEAIQFKRATITEEKIKNTIQEHQKYVGKCYKKKLTGYLSTACNFKYVKLIKAESENEYRMEALTFVNPIKYSFTPILHKKYFPGDKYYGTIEYDGIKVESIGWFTCYNGNEGYEEISLEEFNEALDEHVKELKKMNWGK